MTVHVDVVVRMGRRLARERGERAIRLVAGGEWSVELLWGMSELLLVRTGSWWGLLAWLFLARLVGWKQLELSNFVLFLG